jgi:RNA polymerase-binding transcription factor DksA
MTEPLASTRASATHVSVEQLERLRADLEADLAAQRHHVAEVRQTAEALMGQQDSDSLLEREIAERSAAHGMEVIVDIQHALAGLEAGTYGACERCGGPIAAPRLEAIPHTRFCVSCSSDAPRLV